ncbi:MAG: SDR family oxidoreductase [Chloroflexota bacterium]
MTLKVLFIGGTGVISSACSELALARGIDLYLLNRGQSSRLIPEGTTQLIGDIRQPETVRKAIAEHTFDVVVDWIAFSPEHIETDVALFKGKTNQFIFISSASAYQTPPRKLPITESTPLHNPFWAYSRAKAACEERLMRAYREEDFPAVIIRPSHTYDCTKLPVHGYYTTVQRMRQGKKVILHGDGTSLWTLTHHRDFAKAFVGLMGNSLANGEAFHITSDEVLTWNQIYDMVAQAAGTTADIVHVPSSLIGAYDPEWGEKLLGDKANNMVLDNSKIKRYVPDFEATIPFSVGAKEIMAWFDADPARQEVDPEMDALMDKLIAVYEGMLPD